MDPSGNKSANVLALFAPEGEWARTRILEAQAVETCEFDLELFARYRTIRLLTYSASVQMLHTVLERFSESRVECVLGYSRVVNNVASIIALQTAAMEDVRGALCDLPASSRDAVRQRVEEGRLRVRVVEGHVSHAKIFLLSDGPGGDRCVLTGSANFSASALLGDQHEVLIGFRDDVAWEHFEGQYLKVREHASAEVELAELLEHRLEPDAELAPESAPVLAPGRGAQLIALAQPAESRGEVERGRRVEKLYDVVLPVLPKEATREDSATVKLDAPARKRFSGILRRQTRRVEAAHPTFSVDPVSGTASVCGSPWPLEHDDAKVGEDAASLVAFFDAYRTAFRGRIEKLQRDYFTFLCWMFFSPFICTLRRQAALEGRDVIRFPRVGIIYGKANSGKTQLVEIAGKFMFGDEFQGAIRSRLTTQHLRAIEASYQRMPAFFDDVGWRRFRDHAPEYIKDETVPAHDETPCTVVSMNARAGSFPDELAKRCLLIYSSASLPSDDESGRIAMSDRLNAIEPTTHLYRRYVHEVLGRLDAGAGDVDWLELSSRIVSGLLGGAGHHPQWARPLRGRRMRRRVTTRFASSCEASSTRPGAMPRVHPRTPKGGTRTGGRSGSGSERARSDTRTSSGGICRPTCCTSTRAGRRSSCSTSRRPRNFSATRSPARAGALRSGPGRGSRRWLASASLLRTEPGETYGGAVRVLDGPRADFDTKSGLAPIGRNGVRMPDHGYAACPSAPSLRRLRARDPGGSQPKCLPAHLVVRLDLFRIRLEQRMKPALAVAGVADPRFDLA